MSQSSRHCSHDTPASENIRGMGRRFVPRLKISPSHQEAEDGQMSWASSRGPPKHAGQPWPGHRAGTAAASPAARHRIVVPSEFAVPGDRRRRIDIAFTRHKIAVFVDGCFWHRCPAHYVSPKANADFWEIKTRGNAERDAETTAKLTTAAGWSCASGSTRTLGRWQNASG